MSQGSFTDLMGALEGLHQQVADALAPLEVRVYRWRPVTPPKLPAIYPWIADSPYRIVATSGLVEDTVNLRARVATRHVNGVQDGAMLERIIDAYRSVVDTALYDPVASPFNGIAKTVDRGGMRNVIDSFNDVPVLCMEFSLTVALPRVLTIP